MTFQFHEKVLFRHCDPAGIVFFPRYFEMMNDCVEAFFDEKLGMPFESLHLRGGAPTAQIQSRFVAPSRHGDRLVLTLGVTKIGGSSMSYTMTAHCDDELRFETQATIVHVNAEGRPVRWSEDIRGKLKKFMVSQDQSTSSLY